MRWDVHNHAVPREAIELLRSGDGYAIKVEGDVMEADRVRAEVLRRDTQKGHRVRVGNPAAPDHLRAEHVQVAGTQMPLLTDERRLRAGGIGVGGMVRSCGLCRFGDGARKRLATRSKTFLRLSKPFQRT